MRWWNERRNPALKCERLGHVPAVETRRGWVPAEYSWHVMDRVTQERPACSRCGAASGEWKTTDRDGFSSVSWPTELWDEYRANGYERWIEHGWAPIPPSAPSPSLVAGERRK